MIQNENPHERLVELVVAERITSLVSVNLDVRVVHETADANSDDKGSGTPHNSDQRVARRVRKPILSKGLHLARSMAEWIRKLPLGHSAPKKQIMRNKDGEQTRQ
jgi:hypothetical protein